MEPRYDASYRVRVSVRARVRARCTEFRVEPRYGKSELRFSEFGVQSSEWGWGKGTRLTPPPAYEVV